MSDNSQQWPQDPQLVSKLAYQIVRQKISTQAKVSQVLEEYGKQFEGTSSFAYLIRQADQTLVAVDRSNGEFKHTYRLPLPPSEGKSSWIATSPNYVAVINGSTGRWQKVVERSGSFGLALTGGHGLLSFPTGIVPEGQVLYQDQWVFEQIPERELASGPLDLYVPPRAELLVVADRADGRLHLIDPRAGEILKSLRVRETRSAKAVAVAVSAEKPQAFATDQAGPDLILIDFETRAARRLPQPHGTLGNLVLSPDDCWLYALRTDSGSAPALLAIRTSDLALVATIGLKGKWFSHLDDPIDLVAISPSGRWLCTMTYVDEPSLMTPLLTVIDLEKLQIQETAVLQKDEKPAALAFLAPEPRRSTKAPRSFGDLLVDKRIVDPATLRKLMEEVERQLAEAQKPALDSEVAKLVDDLVPQAQIKDEEVQELAAPTTAAVERLVAGDAVDWIANEQLDKGERRAFAQRVADIKADEGTSRANSALVVHWIRPEEEKEPEAPPDYRLPESVQETGPEPSSGGAKPE